MQDQQKIGIKGWHTISVCDVRHPEAKKTEKSIMATSEYYATKEKTLLECLYVALAHLTRGDDPDAPERVQTWRKAILDVRNAKHAALTDLYELLRGFSGVNVFTVPNIIPTAGRAVIARWLTGDNTYSGDDGANYGSLGTSATAPTNSDTQLTTETYRKATSSVARSNNIATLSNFYTATEVTGTFEEAGWHIAGTGSANTGQLLSHFLTTTIAKSSTETLTVESSLTIS